MSDRSQSHEAIPGQERRVDHLVHRLDDRSAFSFSCSIARGQLQRRQEQVVQPAIDGPANQACTNQLRADASLTEGNN